MNYSVSKGHQERDWRELIKLGQAGELTTMDHAIATQAAASWITCAVGNQCRYIPRDELGEPLDKTLAALGGVFLDAFQYRNWDQAERVLDSIEARSTQILQRMGIELESERELLPA